MIVNFRHKGIERLFRKDETKAVRQDQVVKLRTILTALNVAEKPEDMDMPGFRLHPLAGDLKGFWSVTVSANWRVIFRFEDDNNVCDVQLIDYH